ncbi:nicotinamide riboside transporter PnuC [Ferruginibacter sp.]
MQKSTFKLLSTLFFLLLLQYGNANTYYISPNGNDDHGNGSAGSPWRSLNKATSSVTNAGDIIHVLPGNYNEIVRCKLAAGVSIEGEGEKSVIQSSLTEEFVAIIIAFSDEGVDGNQHISNLTLDGNNATTSWAIEIRGRKNMSIHDCIIRNFQDRGVVWTGREDNEEGPPKIYATGNSFYNNTVTNCAKYDNYGRGCLNIGGQEGMLIYNNKITQTGRARGANGWPIKYYNGGYLRGCKIYNNTIIKEAYDGISWDFAIELFNESGLEIYNNTIVGAIDINHQVKNDYRFSVYIHDNIIGPASLQPRFENGITMEYESESVIIEHNQIKNVATPIYFTPREGCIISDIQIRNNTCENIGVADKSQHGYAINFISGGQSYFINNFVVDNNKFLASETAKPYYGIGFAGATFANNIKILNNTLKNFSVAAITANPAFVIDTMLVEGNTFSGNGNGNNPFFTRGIPTNYTFRKNTRSSFSGSNASFNLTQRIIRPVYYEVMNSSVLDLIAMAALIVAFFLCSRENVYFFPLFMIYKAIMLFIGFDQEMNGAIGVNLCYLLLCTYGWKLWLKRDRKKHRIVRVTSSAGKDWLIQAAIFAASFAMLFILMQYFKKSFGALSYTWAGALAEATFFTGTWLLVNKKFEAWYWMIASAIISASLYFMNNYLVNTGCYLVVIATAVIGFYQWKKRKNHRRRSAVVAPVQ